MEKEEVFAIMGKYYGNAYYRDQRLTREDAALITKILDEINSLGYNFSNLHKLATVKDTRFIDILIRSYSENEQRMSEGLKQSIVYGLHFRGYDAAVPFLLEVYRSEQSEEDFNFKFGVSSSIQNIFSKKYVDDYLQIVMSDGYTKCDCIYSLLCCMKEERAYQRIVGLVKAYPDEFKFMFLKDGWKFKKQEMVAYFTYFYDDPQTEIRTMAKRAAKKINESAKTPQK